MVNKGRKYVQTTCIHSSFKLLKSVYVVTFGIFKKDAIWRIQFSSCVYFSMANVNYESEKFNPW